MKGRGLRGGGGPNAKPSAWGDRPGVVVPDDLRSAKNAGVLMKGRGLRGDGGPDAKMPQCRI